jgi:hypothetical protein
MVVLVASRIRQALARSTFYSSVAGDSMLARLRSTTIALLGVVTAVGLGLVAFISQLGFPGVFDEPIPDGPGGSAAVHGAIALTPTVGTGQPAPGGHLASARVRSSSPPSLHTSGSAAGPDLGGSNQVGHVSPTGQPPAGHAQPPSTTAPPEPAGEQAPTPESPASPTASPKSEPPAQPGESSSTKPQSRGHSGKKAKDHSGEKANSQADAKPDDSSTGESKGHHSAAKAKRHSGAPSKPTDGSSGNSDEPGASSAKGSSPPPSADGEKVQPEVESKETGDSGRDGGKSGKSHH